MDRRQFIIGSLAVMGAKVPAFSAELAAPKGAWVLRAKDEHDQTIVWAEIGHQPITGFGRIEFDDVTWENASGGHWNIARFTVSPPDDYDFSREVELPVLSPIPTPICEGDTLTVSDIAVELL